MIVTTEVMMSISGSRFKLDRHRKHFTEFMHKIDGILRIRHIDHRIKEILAGDIIRKACYSTWKG